MLSTELDNFYSLRGIGLKQLRDALWRDVAKVGTPSSAGPSSQFTAVPWRRRVGWAVARIGQRELSGAALRVSRHNSSKSGMASLIQACR